MRLAALQDLPEILPFIRAFFAKRFDTTVLQIYGDKLEEEGNQESAEFFHGLTSLQTPKKKGTFLTYNYVQIFYRIFGSDPHIGGVVWTKQRNTWFFIEGTGSSFRYQNHIIAPGYKSYGLSLTNGKWVVYENTGDGWVRFATPSQLQNDPHSHNMINLRDYQPISVNEVPTNILLAAFYQVMEHHVRGGL